MEEPTLSIGEVAARAGLNVSAIRYYEREGLLPEAERLAGRRRFPPATVERLGLIAVAKRAGFSLDEVRMLLDAADGGAPAHEQLRAIAERKLPEVEALISHAETVRGWLTAATACTCERLDRCALFVS
jgi:MerR family redox-sensitive transcriptional activator SoxR